MVAHGGNTQPPLFRAGITSSSFLPSQYDFDAPIMEVSQDLVVMASDTDQGIRGFLIQSQAKQGEHPLQILMNAYSRNHLDVALLPTNSRACKAPVLKLWLP